MTTVSKDNARVQLPLRLAYLCLQATREGQASHAHVHEIIRGLERRGWTVELFEPSYARSGQRVSLAGKLFAFVGTQIRLWVRLRRFALLYVRSHPWAIPSVLAAKILGVPTVYEINGNHEDLFVGFPWTRQFAMLFRMVLRLPLRLATQRIAVTQELKEWANREAGEKACHVIPNGANDAIFCPSAKTNRRLPQPYAVFFGALAPWQGVVDLLAAVALPQWPEQVSLVVVGDGVERDRVEEAAEKNSKVVYLSRVPYHEVPGIVAGSLVGFCTKRNIRGLCETGVAPLKLFETMACGVPVIVTDFPGQADLVRTSDCGVVIPEAQPEAIASAVRQLADTPERCREMGKRGREAVVAHHSWDCRAAATSEALLNLVAGVGK